MGISLQEMIAKDTSSIHIEAAPAAIESAIQEDEDQTMKPLQTLMEAAAREEEPARSCGPFVALFGFNGGAVDDAYQAWLARSRPALAIASGVPRS